MVRRRVVRATALAVIVGMLVAGCVSVPTSGRVQSVNIRQPGTGQSQDYLQPIPVPPGRDWTPGQIVSGFLAANASFAGSHAVARQYLTPAASKTWQPGWAVTVYGANLTVSQPPAPLVAPRKASATTVTVSGQVLGSVTSSDQYVVSSASHAAGQATFRLVRRGGQWRISALPDHLVLTQSDFQRVYQPRNLYFFAPSGQVLVPEPVYVPQSATPTDLVTGLVQALTNGPAGWLRGAVRTGFPQGTKLLSDVALDSGTAIVDLGGTAAHASDATLQQISAQLLWTLAGTCSGQAAIQSVELEVDGKPRTLPGKFGPVQHVGSYCGYVPSPPERTRFYYVDARGAVETMPTASSGAGAEPQGRVAPGGAGTGDIPLAKAAVSPDRRYVAGLSQDGSTVYTGSLSGGAPLSRRMNGGALTSLSWDSYDDLWVAGRGGVWMLPAGRGPAFPAYAELPAGGHVTALRVAPDGVRCAMIVTSAAGSQLVLGAIVHTGRQAVIGATEPITSGGSDFTALTWYDADHVIALTQSSSGSELEEIPVNGGNPYKFPAAYDSVSITADGPSNPLVAGLSDGQMVTLASLGGLWSGAVGTGGQPVYPG